MSRFYVGQRVRIKWSIAWPELAGEIGTITARDAYRAGHPLEGESCWVIAPDAWGCPFAPNVRTYSWGIAAQLGARDEQLEPATDSYDKVEWSECLWRPTHDEVSA